MAPATPETSRFQQRIRTGLPYLIFLPIANKLKNIIHTHVQYREMIVEGMVSIAEGENPRNIETKLLGFLR